MQGLQQWEMRSVPETWLKYLNLIKKQTLIPLQTYFTDISSLFLGNEESPSIAIRLYFDFFNIFILIFFSHGLCPYINVGYVSIWATNF